MYMYKGNFSGRTVLITLYMLYNVELCLRNATNAVFNCVTIQKFNSLKFNPSLSDQMISSERAPSYSTLFEPYSFSKEPSGSFTCPVYSTDT